MNGKSFKRYKKSGSFHRACKKKRIEYEALLNTAVKNGIESKQTHDSSPIENKVHPVRADYVPSSEFPTFSIDSNAQSIGSSPDSADNQLVNSTLRMSTSSVIVEPLDTTVKEISPRDTTNAIRSSACDFNITHRALKEILSIIRHDYGDKDLPMDPRTLMRTPQRTGMTFKSISGGQYWHQGLEICLKKSFEHLTEDIQIELNVNIDGLPIHRSSKYQFWPILCNVHQMPHIPPMTVGIFLGKIKPQNITEYLTPFVEELISVLSKGV
ncbi:uncharacterized protein LOC129722408 [Wyeomyia smithii]|uniref:uncharacterized protein LOC129722408 n=1 Tax=Wyeomyia smithii TaxID=174621 RepID=UPI002467F8D2|nr:uncharacterized protein LOC129722408 [Wyeomyia smithii]